MLVYLSRSKRCVYGVASEKQAKNISDHAGENDWFRIVVVPDRVAVRERQGHHVGIRYRYATLVFV